MIVTLPKNAEEVSHYLPHSGSMCLIDEVIALSELKISARTCSHQDNNNPLKFGDKLPAVSGIEYAAQAMALHLELSKTNNHPPKVECFLVAVQNYSAQIHDLDSITCPLNIDCTQIYLGSQRGASYEFTVSAALKIILTGQLLIMFK